MPLVLIVQLLRSLLLVVQLSASAALVDWPDPSSFRSGTSDVEIEAEAADTAEEGVVAKIVIDTLVGAKIHIYLLVDDIETDRHSCIPFYHHLYSPVAEIAAVDTDLGESRMVDIASVFSGVVIDTDASDT
ncbi:unnamed protein product [Peronospora belbahrii]|uniref:Secreted protein n=1 Tax=Peronospora belbahrii TaxID=622444 RepID=A0ABN8D228_9STRA|nr:unnamed protein product [Peronospora belbahrii]